MAVKYLKTTCHSNFVICCKDCAKIVTYTQPAPKISTARYNANSQRGNNFQFLAIFPRHTQRQDLGTPNVFAFQWTRLVTLIRLNKSWLFSYHYTCVIYISHEW